MLFFTIASSKNLKGQRLSSTFIGSVFTSYTHSEGRRLAAIHNKEYWYIMDEVGAKKWHDVNQSGARADETSSGWCQPKQTPYIWKQTHHKVWHKGPFISSIKQQLPWVYMNESICCVIYWWFQVRSCLIFKATDIYRKYTLINNVLETDARRNFRANCKALPEEVFFVLLPHRSLSTPLLLLLFRRWHNYRVVKHYHYYGNGMESLKSRSL